MQQKIKLSEGVNNIGKGIDGLAKVARLREERDARIEIESFESKKFGMEMKQADLVAKGASEEVLKIVKDHINKTKTEIVQKDRAT